MKLFTWTLVTLVFIFSNAHAQVLATVGKKKITVKEFNKKYEDVKRQTNNPPPASVFLEDLIRFEVGVQEAYKRKMDKDPVVRDQMRQELYKGLLERKLGSTIQKIKVSEKEMKAYYRKHPELRTSHILIKFSPGASQKVIAEARKRALSIYADVKKSKKPFKDLAKIFSEDEISKSNGGDIGYQSQNTLVPSYYSAANKLKVGALYGLVRTRYGFHIIKLTARRAYKDANKYHLKTAVFDAKRRVVFNNYFKKVKKSYSIKLNKKAIKEL